MSIMVKGQKFSVRLTRERIGGEDGIRSFLGVTEEGANTVVIDGTMPKTRQEEVLLHELIHLCTDLPEFAITAISTNLYGIMRENGLLVGNIVTKVADGRVSKAEMNRLNHESEAMLSAPMILPMRTTEEKFQARTDIQTLILSKERFDTKAKANAWIKEHDFKIKPGAPDETEESWRYRQREPGEFQPGSFRTITLTDGVKAVIGRPKAD